MKEVKEFPNYYITSNGDVISKRMNKPISKWVDNVGYYQCIMYKEGKRNYKRIHRVMAETFLMKSEKDAQLDVNHIDGNKLNNNINNLELVNNSQNTQHGYNQGLYKTNKRSVAVKVYKKSDSKVVNIYKSIREASVKLDLNRKTISAIMFDGKTNNYDYIFEPIIEEDFYYIQVFDANGNYIDVVSSIAQASEITKIDRHKISDIINKRIANNTNYMFEKQYKNKQWSQETIKSTIA